MNECKWSHYKLGHYFQMRKDGVFQIIGKRKGQWRVVVTLISKNQKIMNASKEIHGTIFGGKKCGDDRIDPITISKIIKRHLRLAPTTEEE